MTFPSSEPSMRVKVMSVRTSVMSTFVTNGVGCSTILTGGSPACMAGISVPL